jgi:hypothetical protein
VLPIAAATCGCGAGRGVHVERADTIPSSGPAIVPLSGVPTELATDGSHVWAVLRLATGGSGLELVNPSDPAERHLVIGSYPPSVRVHIAMTHGVLWILHGRAGHPWFVDRLDMERVRRMSRSPYVGLDAVGLGMAGAGEVALRRRYVSLIGSDSTGVWLGGLYANGVGASRWVAHVNANGVLWQQRIKSVGSAAVAGSGGRYFALSTGLRKLIVGAPGRATRHLAIAPIPHLTPAPATACPSALYLTTSPHHQGFGLVPFGPTRVVRIDARTGRSIQGPALSRRGFIPVILALATTSDCREVLAAVGAHVYRFDGRTLRLLGSLAVPVTDTIQVVIGHSMVVTDDGNVWTVYQEHDAVARTPAAA